MSKTKKLGTLIQFSGTKCSCGPHFLNSLASVTPKIQNYMNLASSIDPSKVICGVVSTYNEANARSLGVVLMQGMRRYFERVQLVDVNSIFKLGKENEIDNNLLGPVGSIVVDNDCEVLQPHSELNAYELQLYVEKMRQNGTAVVLLFGDLEAKQNEMMYLSGSIDKMFFELRLENKENPFGAIEELLKMRNREQWFTVDNIMNGQFFLMSVCCSVFLVSCSQILVRPALEITQREDVKSKIEYEVFEKFLP